MPKSSRISRQREIARQKELTLLSQLIDAQDEIKRLRKENVRLRHHVARLSVRKKNV
jgi:hypothetical protein